MSGKSKSETPIAPAVYWLAAVRRLFAARRPMAIFSGIRTVVIDAVELMIRRRPPPHVGEKAGVAVPSRMYRDPSPTIALPILVLGIATAVAHVGPHFPFGGAPRPIAMARVFAADGRVLGAATRLHIPGLQIVGRNHVIAATIATAKPVSIAGFCMSQRNNSQEAKTLGCEVFSHPDQYSIREG